MILRIAVGRLSGLNARGDWESAKRRGGHIAVIIFRTSSRQINKTLDRLQNYGQELANKSCFSHNCFNNVINVIPKIPFGTFIIQYLDLSGRYTIFNGELLRYRRQIFCIVFLAIKFKGVFRNEVVISGSRIGMFDSVSHSFHTNFYIYVKEKKIGIE